MVLGGTLLPLLVPLVLGGALLPLATEVEGSESVPALGSVTVKGLVIGCAPATPALSLFLLNCAALSSAVSWRGTYCAGTSGVVFFPEMMGETHSGTLSLSSSDSSSSESLLRALFLVVVGARSSVLSGKVVLSGVGLAGVMGLI